MKMSVMANSTLSHSYNISVTDYQTGESNTQTHTQSHTYTHIVGLINRSRPMRKAKQIMTLKEPDEADLKLNLKFWRRDGQTAERFKKTN